MFTSPFVTLSLLIAVRAMPLSRRAGEIPPPLAIVSLNQAQLSTPVHQDQIFNGDFLDGVPQIIDGNITVLGLKLSPNGDNGDLAVQIACLNDAALCRQVGNSTEACEIKEKFCEAENFFVINSARLNVDDPASDPPEDCNSKNDKGEAPFACAPSGFEDPQFVPTFSLDTTPSTFEIDNDNGHTLVGTTAGPIGSGLKTSVVDNGNSTFTVAGNLTTYNKALALQIGCLFDEADCNSAAQGADCTAQRIQCQTDNKLNQRTVILSQTNSSSATPPDGIVVDVPPPVDPTNLIFRRWFF